MIDLTILFVMVILFCVSFYFVFSNLARKSNLNRRTNEYITVKIEEEAKIEKQSFGKSYVSTLSKAFRWVPYAEKTITRLQQAGSDMTPAEFFALRFSAAGISAIIVYFLNWHWLFMLAGFLIGFYIPLFFIIRQRKKRLALLTYQLVETLGTMANSLRAGFSFMQAMKMMSEEMPDPIGPEFGRVVRETRLGIPLEDALKNLVERLPNTELEVIVQAIIAQRESGGNLVELLLVMEETIRGRVRVLEELNTLVAQGKLSSWIITGLPVGLVVFINFSKPDYLSVMFEHPLGWLLTIGAVISMFIGWLIIQKVIKIEV